MPNTTIRSGPRRDVVLVDEVVRWVRRPRDLVSAITSLVSIALVMLLAVYGSATTLAVTRDVRTATSGILESILFMPINVLEGLLSFFLPLAVIIDLIWHRRLRSLVTAMASVASAVAISYGMLWLFENYFPLSPITGQLSDSLAEQSIIINLLPYVSVISALLTVAGSRRASKTTSWGWPLLSVALVISVLQGNQTLPGALITVFIGMFCGQMARYVAGDVPDRSTELELIRLVRRGGIDATHIVRIDELPDDAELAVWNTRTEAPLGYVDRYGLSQIREILDSAGATLSGKEDGQDGGGILSDEDEQVTPEELSEIKEHFDHEDAHDLTIDPGADPELLRAQFLRDYHPPVGSDASRNYIALAEDGTAHHLALLDADQHIVGVLSSLWNRIVLTTTTRRSERTIEASADRLALMELAATNAHVCPDRSLKIASSDKSMLAAFELNGGRTLQDLNPDEVSDSVLDELWDLLQEAHTRGISHGDIHAGTLTVRNEHIELLHWHNGSLASSEVTRRIDMAQAVAVLAAHIGVERTLASAQRRLPLDQLITMAPLIQKTILPAETLQVLSDRKQLQALRDALLEVIPEASTVEPMQLRRFSPKTVVTVSIGLVAVYLLLGSVNFEQLRDTMSQAVPGWMFFAFFAGLFTYVGAAIILKAYTAEQLSLRDTTLVQVAASVVNLVAPAGIGPAALNLRFLQKNKVSTPVAIATVSLVQVAQFVTTVLLLVVLGLLTGNIGSFSVPTGTVVVVFLGIVIVLAVVFLIKPLRRWILEKIRPTIDQIWPRLVWLGTHPSRVFYGFLGSVLQTVAFVAAFGGSLAAFGYSLPVVTLAVTYLVSNSVGSLVPSPGGIGPVEAALTGGLTLAGVPASIAFSTAILYRLFTFWGRVPLGWFALRYCQKKEFV
ncbi:lysylphosphatidylglycerol synthase transmembrane domain-containing protein [Actinomycetaceae bacterium L2_0104]